MTFPQDFDWGATIPVSLAAGPAPAGMRVASLPDGVRPSSGNGFSLTFAEDLGRLASLGLRSVRITLDWARIEPADGHVDTAAVEHLERVLTAAHDAGLAVWGCLVDGDLPGWFAHDERGFRDDRARTYHWPRHVDLVGEAFGDLVDGWVPVHHRPRSATGWLLPDLPPDEDRNAFESTLAAWHRATIEAALRLRGGRKPVASSQWLAPIFPARVTPDAPPTADAEAMASLVDRTLREVWLRLLEEEAIAIPDAPPMAVPGAREAFDLVGFAYSHAIAVRGDGVLLPYPQTLPTDPAGRVPWAEGFGIVLHRLADALPDRGLLVTGVGIATGDEARREEYLRDVLAIAGEAVSGGMDLRGLWWSGAIDGDGPPELAPGLLDRDRATRPAASLLSSVIGGAEVPS